MVSTSATRLYAEVSFIAYHFHWGLDDILDLEHLTRQRFVGEIGELNRQHSKGA